MLEKMLADMVAVTRTSPIAVHQVLKGGLHIYLRRDEDGFHLVLMRQKTKPSMQEWNTVLDYWPWDVLRSASVPQPSTDEHEINFFLTGLIADGTMDSREE